MLAESLHIDPSIINPGQRLSLNVFDKEFLYRLIACYRYHDITSTNIPYHQDLEIVRSE